jgi:uncharacterized membrane protein YpjA
MEQQPDDSEIISYRSSGSAQLPRASWWATPISFAPHAVFWISLRLYQRVFHYHAPLLEVLADFCAVSAIIFSIVAIMFFSKKRKTIAVVADLTLHSLWLVSVFVYLHFFGFR